MKNDIDYLVSKYEQASKQQAEAKDATKTVEQELASALLEDAGITIEWCDFHHQVTAIVHGSTRIDEIEEEWHIQIVRGDKLFWVSEAYSHDRMLTVSTEPIVQMGEGCHFGGTSTDARKYRVSSNGNGRA